MTEAGQTVCLCMIVKNEAPVIRRCLDSVRGLIDAWVIVDTGSTDGTQDIIAAHFSDLPGALFARPWVDFAHNRTEALALARDRADYTLIIDADDTLEAPTAFRWPALTADGYTLRLEDSGIVYGRTQLVRSALPWRYEGVLHEYLTCEGAGPTGHVDGLVMRRNHDGARRKDPDTYRRDAAILEAALATETRPFLLARYRFYLAQSYRDCGAREQALEHYLARGEMGFWDEEVFYSFYQAAKLREQLGHPEQEVIDTYLRAADALPTRAEALHGASRFCRYKGRNAEGYEIARRGLDIALRPDALFVEPWIYEFGLLDEYAVNAYWAGKYRECVDACLSIIKIGRMPLDDQPRVFGNISLALNKITQPPLFANDFIQTHTQIGKRNLRTCLPSPAPTVLIAILAKQKEHCLPLYFDCLERLDYPKSSISLYIRTNNNTDRTKELIESWLETNCSLYRSVEFDGSDVDVKVQTFGVHEWNSTRFKVLGHIRNVSLRKTFEHNCDFYFNCDLDCFIIPSTLRELVALNLPIVAPFLRNFKEGAFDTNFFSATDENGYYKDSDEFFPILTRVVKGVIEVPLVHVTYLIRRDVINEVTYDDMTARYEFVVFADSARKQKILQYVDNRKIYGYITTDDEIATKARAAGEPYVSEVDRARVILESSWTDDDERTIISPLSDPLVVARQAKVTKMGWKTEIPLLAGEHQQTFTRIYENDAWSAGSGWGSHPINSGDYVKFITTFIRRNRIKSVVDIGCGDWQFSRFIDFSEVQYHGYDIVESIIRKNVSQYGNSRTHFRILDQYADLPPVDLLLCKDVLQHLPNEMVKQYLKLFQETARVSLVTNDSTPTERVNEDIIPGNVRPVMLNMAPFSTNAHVIFTWDLVWDLEPSPEKSRKLVWLLPGLRGESAPEMLY